VATGNVPGGGEVPRRGLHASLTAEPSRRLIRSATRAWTAGEVTGAAAALLPRISSTAASPPPLGIACGGPGWLLAGLVAGWSSRRAPLLFDPNLRGEPDAILLRHPGITLLRDGDAATVGAVPVLRLPVEPEAGATARDAPLSWLSIPRSEEHLASLFTSGSEGGSKMVEKHGQQIFRQIEAVAALLALPRGARVISLVPPFHLLGFFYGLILPLTLEGETLFATDLTGPALQKLLAREPADLVVGTAYQYRAATLTPWSAPLSRTAFICSGAPLDPEVAEVFAARTGAPIRDWYGATELGGVAWRVGREPYTPLPGISWRSDPLTGRLEVRSPWAPPGREEEWVPTDDAVEPVAGDRFNLLGRLGHLVKVGGKRFSSIEVERTLRAMPGVTDAAVVPFDRFGEQALAAFIVAGAPLTEEAVRAFLGGKLAAFKLPRLVRFLPDLPRGALAKLDYAALRRLAAELSPGK
jgi:malonyl-CoA/methylmalonyl-CoA synthetase